MRREARLIENEIDSKLLQLSKCDANEEEAISEANDKVPLLQPESSGSRFERLSGEIESLLSRLTDVNNRMSSVAQHIRNSSATYTLQRHTDILNDYEKEFRKTKMNAGINQDREKLFTRSTGSKGETIIPMSGTSQATSILNREAEAVRK